jgi:hypothetical protein
MAGSSKAEGITKIHIITTCTIKSKMCTPRAPPPQKLTIKYTFNKKYFACAISFFSNI